MLRFDNLCAGYNGAERLHRITASIHSGKLTAVIGPNGCGKSTLLKCAAGIHKPTGGQLFLKGRPYSEYTEKERARIVSYMPQSRLTPEITVRRLVSHGRYPHLKWGQNLQPKDHRIIDAALERTHLTDCADRLVSHLSGGERQRAYLAMMLAQETPLMLLDEPTTYLDPSSQFELMELLRELCFENHNAVVVLHDLSLALEYADEILLMQAGKIVITGTPEEVFLSGKLESVFGINVSKTLEGKYLLSSLSKETQT